MSVLLILVFTLCFADAFFIVGTGSVGSAGYRNIPDETGR